MSPLQFRVRRALLAIFVIGALNGLPGPKPVST